MKLINSFERLGLLSQLELLNVNALPLRWVPFVNVLTLGFGLFLLSSKWLCPPGLQVSLPKVSSGTAYTSALPIGDVLMVDGQLRIFFNRKCYNFNQLEHLFDVRTCNIERLMLQVDESVALKNVLAIIDKAKVFGYKSVVVSVVEL